MSKSARPKKIRLEKTSFLISRHKRILWGRFALRASVVSIAIGLGALLFRNLDLVPDLSYVELAVLSGSEEGQYHSMVERLASTAAAEGATIINTPSRGSLENLQRLFSAREGCEVQMALVQDGFDSTAYQGLELIGRVGRPEALLLLGRVGDKVDRLADLRGYRIGVGPQRSGSAFLAERLYKSLGFEALGVSLENHPLQQQVEMAAIGQLDLAFFVIDEDAELISRAVRERGLKVVGLQQTEALSRRFPFLHFGTLAAGQYDPVRILPPADKPLLRLDTLLLSNGCASHSDVIAIMTLLERANPNFIERNRATKTPPGLVLSESARGFYENQGAELADEYLPWLVDIMPPSNWVYTIMAVSLFFNLAGFLNNQRLALIDLNRVALENDIAILFGDRVSNDEIRHYDPHKSGRSIDTRELDRLIDAYRHHMDKCRRQSLSIFSPIGEEMGYRDQEIIMTATLDALRELRVRLDQASQAEQG
ncbi:MAG: TAXI family TRAP transporter solute-binding subunit [Candidatus Thiodiazotropha sp.]